VNPIATMQDVARLAGVSTKTVSNVINDRPYVSAETRERVHAAITQLDYKLNLAARNLRSGRSGVIGLAVPPSQPAPPSAEPGAVQPATFEDAWPKADRGRAGEVPPQRRSSRLNAQPAEPKAPAAAERPAPPPPPPQAEQPAVTVLKSGVVDGMAYSLYSDGSIEAQMPEGMMRFGSIDELRAHLDHRP